MMVSNKAEAVATPPTATGTIQRGVLLLSVFWS